MTCDVLIIGTGIAGVSCAIKCAELGQSVILLTREKKPETTNTAWAQGGIIYTKPEDRAALTKDFQKASSNTSNPFMVEKIISRSPQIVRELLLEKAQAGFEKNTQGELLYTQEAAHDHARIIYHGDQTGREIQITLLNYLSNKDRFPNVTILSSHTALDLITPNHHGVNVTQRYEENKVLGAYAYDRNLNNVRKILAKKTVLATGGFGSLYLHHSNTSGTRGDGHAMAKRAGARLINMEFVQFHPTTFYSQTGHRRFLITEAIRGEGGVLINNNGQRFMENYHTDMELAPRDVVARSIHNEMIRTDSSCVYLDISFKDKEFLKSRFPGVYAYCLENEIDMTEEPIPVVPAAHYTCGGVWTDDKGRTNLKNLYAVGEVACNGLHGANRLASSSLLEGLCLGYFCAEDIKSSIQTASLYDSKKISDWLLGHEDYDGALVQQDWSSLKQTLWNYAGLIRSKNRLKRADAMLWELSVEISKFYRHARLSDEIIGLRNAVEVALIVVQSSMRNSKSVGCFYLE